MQTAANYVLLSPHTKLRSNEKESDYPNEHTHTLLFRISKLLLQQGSFASSEAMLSKTSVIDLTHHMCVAEIKP